MKKYMTCSYINGCLTYIQSNENQSKYKMNKLNQLLRVIPLKNLWQEGMFFLFFDIGYGSSKTINKKQVGYWSILELPSYPPLYILMEYPCLLKKIKMADMLFFLLIVGASNLKKKEKHKMT